MTKSVFFFQAEDGIRDSSVTGVQTCALPIFNKRRDEVRRQLFFLAAGHPSLAVRSAAKKLEPQLFTAAAQAEWHVADVIKGKDTAEHLGYAQKRYDDAVAALADLERTVKAAAQ